MAANDSKSYIGNLNKLVDQCNNTDHCSIDNKPIYADYFALTEKIESSHKALKVKVGDRVRITNVTLKIGQEKYLRLILY